MYIRAKYVAWRLITDLLTLFSRGLNAILFGGSTAQTLSSRSYIDGMTSRKWAIIGRMVNGLFFWQENHIKASWEAEVERARYTLARIKGEK